MPVTERPSRVRSSAGTSDQSVRLCARRNPEAPREAFFHFRIQARTLERPRASHGAELLGGGAQWLEGGAAQTRGCSHTRTTMTLFCLLSKHTHTHTRAHTLSHTHTHTHTHTHSLNSIFNLSVLYWHDKSYTFVLPKQLQLGCSQIVHI